MEIDFDALLRTFLEETAEGFALMEEALLVLERRADDAEAVATVFRLVHTLKGNALSFGFQQVGDYAHVLEDLLERLRSHQLPVTGDLITLLLKALDALKDMIAAGPTEDGAELPPAEQALLDQLARIAAGSGEDTEPASDTLQVSKEQQGEDPRSEPHPVAGPRARTLRVDLEKLDRLLNLTGEIGVARGRLLQMLGDPQMTRSEILEVQEEADLLYLNLQELVTKLRMVQIGPVFRQHGRTVRDVARIHGKLARLVIEGDEVEVDTTVIEHLRDPLTHMIRNALDHGIELPEKRTAKGKDPCGLLTLRAYHDAGTIVIDLTDDGAGLDRERILRRAVVAGLVPESVALTPPEIDQLIFESGFSTAESVTDLSGRGVGMDVVRRNIEILRGSVGIRSRFGEGTTITIRLPLTLAIIDGLNVGVADETYIIPIHCVAETLDFRAGPTAGSNAGPGVIHLRGRTLPYVRLRDLLRVDGDPPLRENIVVVQYEGGEAGLVVDGLHGESQTVIKPLAKLFQGLAGLSGSAILGDGRVAFILDVPTLIHAVIRREQMNSLIGHPSQFHS